MIRRPQRLVVCLLSLLALSAGWAQRRRDPLNPTEVDQLRDVAQEPEDRLKLYLKFARARLEALNKARADTGKTNRGADIHDALQDFLAVYDELNDNLDTYADRKDDIRKALKLVIEADTEFQAGLRALKDSATATPAEYRQYEFVLTDALETLDSSAPDHRQLLSAQEELAKQKKLVKPDTQHAPKSR